VLVGARAETYHPPSMEALLVLGVVGLIVVGARRLRGTRGRFDHVFEAIVRAQDAAIFPESLRGDQWRSVAMAEDTSRYVETTRRAPTLVIHGPGVDRASGDVAA
jgi:hypothetical protein